MAATSDVQKLWALYVLAMSAISEVQLLVHCVVALAAGSDVQVL